MRDKPTAQIVFFPTRNLEETTRFYRDKLGLPLVLDQGRCRIFGVADSAFLGFCHKETEPGESEAIITLVTEDVDGWMARLHNYGVRPEQGPKINPEFQIYHAFVRDPNGYLVEIQRFDDPRWGSLAESAG